MSDIALEAFEVQTNDPVKVVRLNNIQKFGDGSGYRCNFEVESRGFSCRGPFYFDDVSLADAVPKLKRMATGTPGSIVIKGQWEEDFLQVDSNSMGHVWVSGEIVEHSEYDQRLKFSFRTDQTILEPLARDLQKLLDA